MNQTLPLHHIALYQHGQGIFEHTGPIEGNQELSLSFLSEEIEDVLRTLSVVDLDGGQIRRIRYTASRSLGDRIKQLGLRLNPDQPWPDLLKALSGQSVRLETAEGRYEGVVLGQFREDPPVSPRDWLLLRTAAGIRRIPLAQMLQLECMNPSLQNDLDRWLDLLGSRPERPQRHIEIEARGEGPRRLLLSYSRPMPAWRMAYRLYLQPQAPARLQAWALLDNPTALDWEGVGLTLYSGKPRESTLNLNQSADRLQDDLPVLTNFSEIGGSGAEPENTPADEFQNYDDTQHYFIKEQCAFVAETPAAASAQQNSQRVEYRLQEPVHLPAGQSALVPVLNENISCEHLVSFALDDYGAWPQAALRLRNELALVLDQGPLVIYEDGIYAGEADLHQLPPDETRVLPYAEERRISVRPKGLPSHRGQLVALKLEYPILQIHFEQIEELEMQISSSLERPVRLLLQSNYHSLQLRSREGFPVVEHDDGYDVEVTLGQGETRQVHIERFELQKFVVSLDEPVMLHQHLSSMLQGAPSQEARFESLQALLHQAQALSERKERLEREIEPLQKTRSGLLAHLHALGLQDDTQPLRKRWLDQLMQLEGEQQQLQQSIAQTQAELEACQALIVAEVQRLSQT